MTPRNRSTEADDATESDIVEGPEQALALSPFERLRLAGQAANRAAASGVFADYLSRRSENTLRRQRGDLRLFGEFLGEAGVTVDGDALQEQARLWHGITWGIVEAYKQWMLGKGYAVGSVNVRLSTIKTYARLAFKAGVIPPDEHAQIRQVAGFSRKEAKRVNQKRDLTRVGDKKAEATRLTPEQANALKNDQPDTPQGRRDALMMCLLLDHGLRCGEVALIKVEHVDLDDGVLHFYRPKVDKEQTHKLTADTLRAAYKWFTSGDVPPAPGKRLLRSSQKGGKLTSAGMSERAITKRVRVLGRELGIDRLSAHDCRHYWATHAARSGTDPFALQEAGGWNSLVMPRRYVEDAKVANEGVKGF
jgi:integrase